MTVVARMIHRENPMEERVSRLEAHYEHLREDFRRVENKVDRLESKVDSKLEKLEARFSRLEEKMESQFAAIGAKLQALQTSRIADRVWQLLINAAMLGVMARGFRWI